MGFYHTHKELVHAFLQNQHMKTTTNTKEILFLTTFTIYTVYEVQLHNQKALFLKMSLSLNSITKNLFFQ